MTIHELSLASPVPSGIEGLDEILGGGYPAGKATVIRGASGTGKTILSLKFACDWWRRTTALSAGSMYASPGARPLTRGSEASA